MPHMLCLLMLVCSPCMACAADQPNIIVLLADDLGYGELSCQGNPEIPTPHIDSIAAHGVRMTQAYVTAPNCSPSRAGLLTGRIPTRFGYEFNPIGARNEDSGTGIPIKERTLAERLRERGYTSALIGKWHLGGSAHFHPQRHGFDEFFGFLHEGHFFVPPPWSGVTTMLRRKTLPGGVQGRRVSDRLIYSTHMGHNEPPYDASNPILRAGQPVQEEEYLTDAFTREAVDFIERRKDQPFFLFLAYNAVHSPLQGAEQHMKRFEHIEDIHRRIFAAMLANLDHSVGQVLEAVRKAGLENNTLIFFLSDNGGPTRELTSSNLPLRGGKGQMYEGGLRIPFMVQWKGQLPAGKVYPGFVVSVDIFATAARVAGATTQNIDGVNLMPFLTGKNKDQPRDTFYWRQGNKTAFRKGPWKLVSMKRKSTKPVWELYNIADDMSETTNLAAQQPDRLDKLVTQWQTMDTTMKEPLFR